MNNNIKFRVYSKKLSQFLNPYNLLIDCYGDLYKNNDSENKLGDDYKISQFTTLKDSKNKEIYNGDIIKNYKITGFYNPQEEIQILIVGWSERECGWRGFNNVKCIGAEFYIKEDCEVIGNIFENPELLENL